ncbi:CheR family methyltransferase [Flavitalea sp.]|nr:CheR family methyltransferase [Flavitalea sp.]
MKSNNDEHNSTKPLVKSTIEFPVVGIGASAGGLDSFKKFIKGIPANSDMAYILVQHLAATHESVLPELLQKVTNIPIHEVTDKIRIESNNIYIIPANKLLTANDGVLELSPRPSKEQRSLPVDVFFTSLAEVHGVHAIGVVLSGTGSDGTLGLKAIKDHGGMTFAEDMTSAAFSGMPASAIQADVVDFILPAESIPLKITEINRHDAVQETSMTGKPVHDGEVYKEIVGLLKIRKGTDFTYYKQPTIRRRILRRIALNKLNSPGEYLRYMKELDTEQDILYQDLLIPVTSFFRDQKTFDTLCESVLPNIEKAKLTNEPIRIWIAGCSTGQEAYSFAICLKEYLGNLTQGGFSTVSRVQIFATDISEPAISKARTGIYSKSELEGLSPERLDNFFTKFDGRYQLNKAIRDMCVFAVHNFLKDPPFAKVDLVSCRNVLIYMEPYLQNKALSAFHYALNPAGYLLLGKAENTSYVSDLFATVGKKDKLFIRKDAPGRYRYSTNLATEQIPKVAKTSLLRESPVIDFQKSADAILLSKFSPVGVVVNQDMDIVHFRGNTGSYLEPSPGKASLNLFKMARPGLAFELRSILHKAKQLNEHVVKESVAFIINNEQHYINIEAIPLPHTIEPHFLVLLHDTTDSSPRKPERKNAGLSFKNDGEMLLQKSEQELLQLREDIKSITEAQEAANEELQSANEELLSGSEELQSLNEELEAGKEELQSTNEELTVINQEMIGLNEQLREARNYAEAIITTIREPLLVLDKNMCIKTANRSFYKTFNVNETEVEGSNFFELSNGRWNIPELRLQLEKILPEATRFSDLEVSRQFPNIGHRVMLLNGTEMLRESGDEKLILLAIEDITERALSLKKIEETSERYTNVLMQSPFAFSIMKGKEMVITIANNLMKDFWGKGYEVEGKKLLEVLPELEGQSFTVMMEEAYQSGKAVYANEMLAQFKHINVMEDRYFNIIYQPHLEADGAVTGVITIAHEVTNQVLAHKKAQAQAVMVRNLLMTAPGFVATLIGPTHVYDIVNEQYQSLFGKRKLQGNPIMVASPELEGQGFDKLLDKVFITGEPYVSIDIPITLARDEELEPEVRYFNFSYQPIFDEKQKIISILVFGYEVTQQVISKNKNFEDAQLHSRELELKVQQRTSELVMANEALKKMNHELESFTYISSHDLQEPLRKIQSFVSRLLNTEHASLSEKGKDYFNRMSNAAARMQQLIEDLLDYSHAHIADKVFVKTNLDLIISEMKSDFSDMLIEKSATIEADNLGFADISHFQLRQLINNLITNSLKFARPGVNPHINIKTEIGEGSKLTIENTEIPPAGLSASQQYCHISFTDNGIGFDPIYKEKIFQVFQRLHGKEAYPGTGIGLAIVQKIINNHNGYITATGALGEGARFDIYLPQQSKN